MPKSNFCPQFLNCKKYGRPVNTTREQLMALTEKYQWLWFSEKVKMPNFGEMPKVRKRELHLNGSTLR